MTMSGYVLGNGLERFGKYDQLYGRQAAYLIRLVEGLPVWGTHLYHPEPDGEDGAVLADLDRHPGPCIVQAAFGPIHVSPV